MLAQLQESWDGIHFEEICKPRTAARNRTQCLVLLYVGGRSVKFLSIDQHDVWKKYIELNIRI